MRNQQFLLHFQGVLHRFEVLAFGLVVLGGWEVNGYDYGCDAIEQSDDHVWDKVEIFKQKCALEQCVRGGAG